VPEWRNWQTRMVQVHVLARVWGFESLLRHQTNSRRAAKALSPASEISRLLLARCGRFSDTIGTLRPTFVNSHISPKEGEIWGTRVRGQWSSRRPQQFASKECASKASKASKAPCAASGRPFARKTPGGMDAMGSGLVANQIHSKLCAGAKSFRAYFVVPHSPSREAVTLCYGSENVRGDHARNRGER
jgi:hypothetical protein